ncbi:MAG: FAD-dependent oxidoreductase [Aureliella sp.]
MKSPKFAAVQSIQTRLPEDAWIARCVALFSFFLRLCSPCVGKSKFVPRRHGVRHLTLSASCVLNAHFALAVQLCTAQDGSDQVYDVVIYGQTSAGVVAAIEAKRLGKSVLLTGPDKHLGGLTAGGLGWTDTGNKAVIGGLAREFYHRVWKHYDQDSAWRWQRRSEYGNRGQGTAAIDGNQRTQWIFEPHVAEAVFEQWISESGIDLERETYLDRSSGSVRMVGGIIQTIRMLDGSVVRGRVFMDATYEGDLLAAAGVDFHVGREANSTYQENWNGIQVGVLHHKHWFQTDISPYQVPGVVSSGLLPGVSEEAPGKRGDGDSRIQAYCYRMCLTDLDENRIPFPKPDGYDPNRYALLVRVLNSEWNEVFSKFDPIPNRKTDTNNHGPFSTDNIGQNYDYPEASYERRREILREHEIYQKGLMYFLANDEAVPENIRREFARWGLAKDEFTDNGGWPHQIYVREARRMIGEYVMTENDVMDRRPTPKSIGMGSYTMDSHNVQRYVKPDGFVQNEGDIGVGVPGPYEISYDSITPQREQCKNLLVPVCVSSSHIAFGSIRMEPVFMILGHSAAAAASFAIDDDIPVQDVNYAQLSELLTREGQILEVRQANENVTGGLPGTVVDDSAALLTGNWHPSKSTLPFVGYGYVHDANSDKGNSRATFEAKLPNGAYKVRLSFSPHGNRATNVPVQVKHALGVTKITVNQRDVSEGFDGWFELGVYRFQDDAKVEIGNQGTDGHVIVDAVQFLEASKGD